MAKKTSKKAPEFQAPVAEGQEQIPRPRLHRLRVRNFRCIGPSPVEVELDDIVVLVGPNNVGKSSILRAYEVVMQHGSKQGELSQEDFPNGCVDDHNLPEIELETVVFDERAPGATWIRRDLQTGEMFVREKWMWSAPGKPKKVGWNVELDGWDPEHGPWGAPGVAQPARPEAHRIRSFQDPQGQADEIVGLLKTALTARIKALKAAATSEAEAANLTQYQQLIEDVKKLQKAIVDDAKEEIQKVEDELSTLVEKVFPGHVIKFDARPEDDPEKCIDFFKAAPQLRMGLSDGHLSTIEQQGSGARRTLLWTALKILSEQKGGTAKDPNARPHLLLMDEPELCLHPNAIREARRVLYDLPATGNWQVMVTTHSPVFIDLSRDNTSIVRVERGAEGAIRGTTIFRPKRAQLDEDDRARLKLLNQCDPYVAEFFFGGRTVVVEGDTEFTAFCHVIAHEPDRFKNVHIVRARGKAPIASLCKILNQFGAQYAVLHDSDQPEVMTRRTRRKIANPAWTTNENILLAVKAAPQPDRVRLVASVPNLELAFLGTEAEGEKPYAALSAISRDGAAFGAIASLLEGLVEHTKPLPPGAVEWGTLDQLKAAVEAWQAAGVNASGSGEPTTN